MNAVYDAFGSTRHIAKHLSFASVQSARGEDCVAIVLHDEDDATGGPRAFFIMSPANAREAAHRLLELADEVEDAR